MKNRALLMLAVCTVLFSASPVCALTPGTCADWKGTWAFTYDNASRNDTVKITDICSKPDKYATTPDCIPTGGSVRDNWLCIAKGKRVSDNQTVQIRQISMDTIHFAYYEATDEEILAGGPDTTYDLIATDNYTKCTFTGAYTLNGSTSGLASGVKDNCTDTPDCKLEKIIPGTVSKLSAILSPIAPFIIIGSGDPAFEGGDTAAFDSDAIKPVIQLRISAKIIIAICIVRPFKLTPGEVDVSVGDCFGAITVK